MSRPSQNAAAPPTVPSRVVPRPRALFVGDAQELHFEETLAWLAANAETTYVADLTSAGASLQAAATQLVVLGQTRRGQFAATEVAALRSRNPGALWCVVQGPWCEGESRSGHPVPDIERLPWRQAALRLVQLLPSVALPEPPLASPPRRQGLLAIRAATWTDYESLADACTLVGYACVWLPPGATAALRGVRAGLWEGRLGPEPATQSQRLADLAQFKAQLAPAPVLTLMDFPRLDECQAAQQAGAAFVLSKPLMLDDLWRQLDQAIGVRRAARRGERAA